MSNEREEFEKAINLNGLTVHEISIAESAWLACAERKQQEIDEIESRYVGIEEALATIGAERDALAALVERKDEALQAVANELGIDWMRPEFDSARETLSLTAPDALRERDARKAAEVLREAANSAPNAEVRAHLLMMAAAKERGELWKYSTSA